MPQNALRQIRLTGLSLFCLASLSLPATATTSVRPLAPVATVASKLASSAPDLDRKVLDSALQATDCAVNHGMALPDRLAVIDFSLPSDQKRLWIFDLESGALLLNDWVAHGKNSGDGMARTFSNTVGSLQSSLGLFRGEETYDGKHGYSLRLDGLEPGVNDNARDRAIVIHGADYVDRELISKYGRIGRSFGCPAVRQGVAKMVVDNLKDGQLVFSYFPDQDWLKNSSLLNCDQKVASTGRTG
jgi:hypothetical protein